LSVLKNKTSSTVKKKKKKKKKMIMVKSGASCMQLLITLSIHSLTLGPIAKFKTRLLTWHDDDNDDRECE
jgi:hypothetical protein